MLAKHAIECCSMKNVLRLCDALVLSCNLTALEIIHMLFLQPGNLPTILLSTLHTSTPTLVYEINAKEVEYHAAKHVVCKCPEGIISPVLVW